MADLDDRLKKELAEVRRLQPDAGSQIQRFQSRLRRRKTVLAGVNPLLICFLLAAGVVAFTLVRDGGGAPPREALWASPPRFLSSRAAIVTPNDLPGRRLEPEQLSSLPSQGVAVEIREKGTILIDLSGKVLGHLAGFYLWSNEDAPGPLVLRGLEGDFLIDADVGRLRRFDHDNVQLHWPLSYGANLRVNIARDPGGYHVVRDEDVLLDLGNRMDSDFVVSNDRDIVTYVSYLSKGQEIESGGNPPNSNPAIALDLRTNKLRTLPPGCTVSDRHGKAWLLICGPPGPSTKEKNGSRSSVFMLRPNGSTRRLFGSPSAPSAPDSVGHWQNIFVGPDGKTLLAQWSGECEVQTPHLGYIWNRSLPPLGKVLGSDPTLSPNGQALGWTLEGDAVVALPGGSPCGTSYEKPGIYAISTDRKIKLLLGLAPDLELGQMGLWTPLLK